MIPAPIAAWLGTLIGQICTGGAIVALILTAWLSFAHHYENKGAAKVIETSKVEGKKINAKNESVRARADRPGAAQRVRKNYCRDC